MPQFIYTMKGLGKVHPPDIKVLDDIWLSFYFGAKIGVLGANGAGKSSLLRIMAGVDKSILGEAFPTGCISLGFLPQDPRLDATSDGVGIVDEALAPRPTWPRTDRPLVPRPRRRLDSRARSRPRHSVGGQLLGVARAEAAAAGARREAGDAAAAHAGARARMDTHVAARPAGEGQGAP